MERNTVQIRISRATRDRLEGLRDQIPDGVGMREIGDIVGMLSLASAAQVADIFMKAMIEMAANPAAFNDERAAANAQRDDALLDAEAADEAADETLYPDDEDDAYDPKPRAGRAAGRAAARRPSKS